MKNQSNVDIFRELVASAESDSNRVEALNNLAWALYSIAENQEAKDIAEEARTMAGLLSDDYQQARALNTLGAILLQSATNNGAALDLLNRAKELFESSNSIKDIAATLMNIGNVYRNSGDYPQALDCYKKSKTIYEENNEMVLLSSVLANIGNVFRQLKDENKAIEYYSQSLAIAEQYGAKREQSVALSGLGNAYSDIGNFESSLKCLHSSLAIDQELGNHFAIAVSYGNMGAIFLDMNDLNAAFECFQKSLAMHTVQGNRGSIAVQKLNIGVIYATETFEGYDLVQSEKLFLDSLGIALEVGYKKVSVTIYANLMDIMKIQGRWEESLNFFEHQYKIEKELQGDEVRKIAEQFDHERKVFEQEKALVAERVSARERSRILDNILPQSITERLIRGEEPIADRFENVSILFADIIGFTKLSQRISPHQLVESLDRIFSSFDALAEKYCLEKIKTIGDAYMVVSGVPEPRKDHADAMAAMAIEMLETMKQFTSIATGEEIQIRIGIHSGEVVAGVIGKKKFAYDLWGDSVNTASRMESHGEAGKIHVSSDFVRELTTNSEQLKVGRDGQQLITINSSLITAFPRGEMEIKGKGMMKTYFLEKNK